MRGTLATMLAIRPVRLDVNLNDHPLIEYFDDNGQRVGIPYYSLTPNSETA